MQFVGFSINESKARYLLRSWFDFIAVIIYAIGSIYAIWKAEADLVVLGLNSLCLLRSGISNSFFASEVTKKYKKLDIEASVGRNSHYHISAAVLLFLSFLIIGTWWMLYYELGESNNIIKSYSSFAILMVLFNDIEKNVVYAYNASIEPSIIRG